MEALLLGLWTFATTERYAVSALGEDVRKGTRPGPTYADTTDVSVKRPTGSLRSTVVSRSLSVYLPDGVLVRRSCVGWSLE